MISNPGKFFQLVQMSSPLIQSFQNFLEHFFNKILGNFKCNNSVMSHYSMLIFKKIIKKILDRVPDNFKIQGILGNLRNGLIDLDFRHLEPGSQSKLRYALTPESTP